jgi:hypothetical protein
LLPYTIKYPLYKEKLNIKKKQYSDTTTCALPFLWDEADQHPVLNTDVQENLIPEAMGTANTTRLFTPTLLN